MTVPQHQQVRPATIAAFCLPLAVYATTAARTAQGGDTTEFAWLAYAGGVAHPPGYPLYSLVVRLFAHLPFESQYFRIALASALFGAATVALVQHLGARLTGRPWLALLASLVFALSSPQWKLAGVPEVFTMNAMMALVVALCSIRLAESTPEQLRRRAFVLGLTFGLGLSNHHTLILCAPLPLVALVAVARRMSVASAWRAFVRATLGGLVGLTPYLVLLIAARVAGPEALAWGDTRTLSSLLDHFLRREYGTFRLYSGPGQEVNPGRSIAVFATHLTSSFAYAFAAVGVAGLVVALRRYRVKAIALASALFCSSVVFLAIQNIPAIGDHVVARFHLLPMALFAPFVVVGLVWVSERAKKPALLLVLLGIALNARQHFQRANWRADTAVERMVMGLVEPLLPNAIVIGAGDHMLFTAGWVTQVLRVRPDVRYVDRERLSARWYYERVRREIPEFSLPYSAGSYPIEVLAIHLARATPTYVTATYPPHMSKERLQLEPAGLAYLVVPRGTPSLPLIAALKQLETATSHFGTQPAPIDNWSWDVHKQVGSMWALLSAMSREQNDPETSEYCLERATALLPEPTPPERF